MTTSRINRIFPIFLIAFVMTAGGGHAVAQTVTVLTETSATTLPARAVVNQIVFSGAATAREAIDAPKVASAVKPVGMIAASKLLGLAGFGGLPAQIAMSAATQIRTPGNKGFSMYILPARSASVSVAGDLSFHIQSDGDDVRPALMKVGSVKTQPERILQAIHIQCKQADASCAASATVLNTEASRVPCQTELNDDTWTLTPSQPLAPGEYAIVLEEPASGSGGMPDGPARAWDFRVQ